MANEFPSACDSAAPSGNQTWFCAAVDRSTRPSAWQGRQVLLYAAVTTTGSGWYPGAGVVTPTWMASRSCARVPPGEWQEVHHCCVKSATATAGTAANGVVMVEWQVRHGIGPLDGSCGGPVVTSKTMAGLVGSCFPLLELVEYETDAGTFESA